ncbi:MAG: PIN domain-containing protein [Gemmatimonadetes bacterium]|nr:PIN domain-containing protein [Gemmatimonadota bacterium]
MTIGLDTSVVVRLLVGLPESQAARARRRLEAALENGERVVVADLALAETYHALHYHYAMPKDGARALLSRFLESGVVDPDPAGARQVVAARGGAGLVDRLIHQRYRDLGAVTVTFERRQGRLEGAVQLK